MHRLPIIRNPDIQTNCPRVRSAGIREPHDYCRTLPQRSFSQGTPDVLQDEAGAPILDEQTGTQIYDTLREGGTFAL